MIAFIVALNTEVPKLPDSMEGKAQLFYSGVGKVNAAFEAARVALVHKPRIIINYGACASVNYPVGSLLEMNSFSQIDMDCTALGLEMGHTPFGRKGISRNDYANGFTCATADKFIEPTAEYDGFEMEAYAIANSCKNIGLPYRVFKYVTDAGSADDFNNNVGMGERIFSRLCQNLKMEGLID